jgi:RNA polymerase sigma-70 factor, ECF subfamily
VSQGVDPHSAPSPTIPPARPLETAVDPDPAGRTTARDLPGEARTDAELLRAHVDGDAEAFAILVRRHQDRLWAIALRVMRNPEDAADALQDAYIAAFRRAGTYRGDAAVTTWLHRVVVNACLDRLRSLKVRAADALPEDLDRSPQLGADQPADPIEAADQRD